MKCCSPHRPLCYPSDVSCDQSCRGIALTVHYPPKPSHLGVNNSSQLLTALSTYPESTDCVQHQQASMASLKDTCKLSCAIRHYGPPLIHRVAINPARIINMFPLWLLVLLAMTSSVATSTQLKSLNPRDQNSSSAQSNLEEYLMGVCMGNYTWSEPTLPCEIFFTIDYQCSTGIAWDAGVDSNQSCPACGVLCQSYEFQRTCYCQSQFLDSADGCYKCYVEHGGANSQVLRLFDWTGLPSVWDEYCDPLVHPMGNVEAY